MTLTNTDSADLFKIDLQAEERQSCFQIPDTTECAPNPGLQIPFYEDKFNFEMLKYNFCFVCIVKK